MQNNESNNENLQEENSRKNTEELSQLALGNTDATEKHLDNNNDLLSIPKTSGTGSNPSAATPHSLIVHGDKDSKDRYEEGSTNNDQEKNQ